MLKQKIKAINDKLDLSKKYPNYFNKPLLRVSFILAFLFVGIMVLVYGTHNYVFIECEKGYCPNPFVYCKEPTFISPPECKYYNSIECLGANCDKATITAGEAIGEKAPPLVAHSLEIFLAIIAAGFGLNHILWRGKNAKMS